MEIVTVASRPENMELSSFSSEAAEECAECIAAAIDNLMFAVGKDDSFDFESLSLSGYWLPDKEQSGTLVRIATAGKHACFLFLFDQIEGQTVDDCQVLVWTEDPVEIAMKMM